MYWGRLEWQEEGDIWRPPLMALRKAPKRIPGGASAWTSVAAQLWLAVVSCSPFSTWKINPLTHSRLCRFCQTSDEMNMNRMMGSAEIWDSPFLSFLPFPSAFLAPFWPLTTVIATWPTNPCCNPSCLGEAPHRQNQTPSRHCLHALRQAVGVTKNPHQAIPYQFPYLYIHIT